MTSPASAKQPADGKTPRRKVLVRATGDRLPALQLTPRDLAILHGVYVCRALTTPQIQRWFFGEAPENRRGPTVRCQTRLARLFHHGYLYRDEQATRLREGRQPLVYFLDRRGAEVVAGYLHVPLRDLDWQPRDNAAGAGQLFLTHLLKTNDVRIALELAAAQSEWQIDPWLDERSLRRRQMKDRVELPDGQGRTRQMAVVPDGYFALLRPDIAFYHFVEIDLRTTIGLSGRADRRDWARRIQAYVAYHRSGQYQARYGSDTFRVLTVTTDRQRLSHLKTITERVGGKARFWFTTFAALAQANALTAPIWQVAGRSEALALLIEPGNEFR